MSSAPPRELKIELFDQLQQATPHDLIWVFSDEWDELVYLKGDYEGVWGRSREALETNPVDFLNGIHPDDREAVTEAMSRVSNGEPAEVEFRLVDDGTQSRWVEAHGEPIRDADDEIVRVAGFVRDITTRKEREQRLQRQNARLDQFAAVVSHDLRSPLNVAQGRLKLAQEEHDSEDVAAAAAAVDRSLTLVEDLLTLARNGSQVDDPGPVALAEVSTECWRTSDTDDASLEIDTDQTITADATRLKQLLENLLRNAVTHGGEGVTVTVGSLDDGFYVADDGPGIPEAERSEVFDAGYSTTDDGTGFGLNIVDGIAEAHGWDVTLTDSEAGGARFEFTGVPTGSE
jgi:PAS domain S-box-containing protein